MTQTAAAELRALSDARLVERTQALVSEERALTARVIECLEEVDRRKLHLSMSYPSLFEFCTRHLGYSEPSAYRRISAMRLARELPGIRPAIESGELPLTTLTQAQRFFNEQKKLGDAPSPERKLEVLEQLASKSAREVERELAAMSPEAAQPEMARAVSATETLISFTASAELMADLQRLRELWAHVDPHFSYAELVARMARLLVEKLDPLREKERSPRTERRRPAGDPEWVNDPATQLDSIEQGKGRARESARQAQDSALESARQAQDSALESARQAQDSALESARQAQDSALESARQVQNSALESARQVQNSALESARQVQNSALESARQVQNSARKTPPAQALAELVKEPAESRVAGARPHSSGEADHGPSRRTAYSTPKASYTLDRRVSTPGSSTSLARTRSTEASTAAPSTPTPEAPDRLPSCRTTFSALEVDRALAGQVPLFHSSPSALPRSGPSQPNLPASRSPLSTPLPSSPRFPIPRRSRYVPRSIWLRVWKRDQARCTYTDPQSGRPCASRHGLQVDHKIPFAQGGLHTVDNLRIRCAAHNRWAAETIFGAPRVRIATTV